MFGFENIGKIFGFSYNEKQSKEKEIAEILPPKKEPSKDVVSTGGFSFAYNLVKNFDEESNVKNKYDLLQKYREISYYPEASYAIDDVINECIINNNYNEKVADLDLDDYDGQTSTKNKILECYDEIYRLLNFNSNGYKLFKSWYVDGKIYIQKLLYKDDENGKRGIADLRFIDPLYMKKVRVLETQQEGDTTQVKVEDEYYEFNNNVLPDRDFFKRNQYDTPTSQNETENIIKLSKDSICHITSGLYNASYQLVLSYLHYAIKPYNQLKLIEDAVVIYRITRAPERRIFYIDLGDLPKDKAEAEFNSMITKHKNKITYDQTTGEVKNNNNFSTMLEDIWLPRQGNKGTEVTTLPGGTGFQTTEDLDYFKKKLYKSLFVPISRLEADAAFNIGRSSEITRDEMKFTKFIKRLRNKFTDLFFDLLKTQCILKGIVANEEEFEEIKTKMFFVWKEDSYYEEIKEIEILNERVETINRMQYPIERGYFSDLYIRKNILRQTEEEIKEIDEQIKKQPKPEPEEDFTTSYNNSTPKFYPNTQRNF